MLIFSSQDDIITDRRREEHLSSLFFCAFERGRSWILVTSLDHLPRGTDQRAQKTNPPNVINSGWDPVLRSQIQDQGHGTSIQKTPIKFMEKKRRKSLSKILGAYKFYWTAPARSLEEARWRDVNNMSNSSMVMMRRRQQSAPPRT